jgi:hypothetical protein
MPTPSTLRARLRDKIGTFFEQPLLRPAAACSAEQCVGVCPTGALKPKRQWLLEQGQTPDEIMAMTRNERRKRRPKPGSAPGAKRDVEA